MERPDLDTLACVKAACPRFRQTGQSNLVIRKVYGHDAIRLLRCCTCGEEFSERRGTALFNTKVPEAKAVEVIDHLTDGWSVRSTARLPTVCKETGARLLRVSGRHAARCHDEQVHDLPPRAFECDAQWAFVKQSTNAVPSMSGMRWVISGTIGRWLPIASEGSPCSEATAPTSPPWPWCKMPKGAFAMGTCQPSSPMPLPATSRLW